MQNVGKATPTEKPWARTWATHRSQHSSFCNKETPTGSARVAVPVIPFTGVRPPCRRKKVVAPSEKEVAVFKRLQAVYGNTKDRVLRAEKLRQSLSSLQNRTMRLEISASLRDYTNKNEQDRQSRRELKRVRERYSRDKERRNRFSFVSLNALEAPQVPRQAYGLPDEGQELNSSGALKKTQKELRNIWHKSMRRAAIVHKMVQLPKQENNVPKIELKPTKHKHKRSRQGEVWVQGTSPSCC